MKMHRRFAVLSLTLLLGACANMAPNQDAEVDALIRAAGVDAQLAILSQPLDPKSINGANGLLPNEVIDAVNSAVAGVLNPDQIRASIKSSLLHDMSGSQLYQARRFFESSVGQHVVAAETGPVNTAYAGGASEDQLNALDDATGVSRIFGDLAEQSTSSAVDALIATNCLGQNKLPFASMMGGVIKKAEINAVRRSVRREMNTRYAALAPDEVASYLDFAQSSAGQQFFRSRNQAIATATTGASAQISTLLTQQVEKNCKG